MRSNTELLGASQRRMLASPDALNTPFTLARGITECGKTRYANRIPNKFGWTYKMFSIGTNRDPMIR